MPYRFQSEEELAVEDLTEHIEQCCTLSKTDPVLHFTKLHSSTAQFVSFNTAILRNNLLLRMPFIARTSVSTPLLKFCGDPLLKDARAESQNFANPPYSGGSSVIEVPQNWERGNCIK